MIRNLGTKEVETLLETIQTLTNINIKEINIQNESIIEQPDTTIQTITIDSLGFSNHTIICKSTNPTTFTIDISMDNINYFNYYTSPSAETSHIETTKIAIQYMKISSAIPATTGGTISLIGTAST